jgi:hypothetical protein
MAQGSRHNRASISIQTDGAGCSGNFSHLKVIHQQLPNLMDVYLKLKSILVKSDKTYFCIFYLYEYTPASGEQSFY